MLAHCGSAPLVFCILSFLKFKLTAIKLSADLIVVVIGVQLIHTSCQRLDHEKASLSFIYFSEHEKVLAPIRKFLVNCRSHFSRPKWICRLVKGFSKYCNALFIITISIGRKWRPFELRLQYSENIV